MKFSEEYIEKLKSYAHSNDNPALSDRYKHTIWISVAMEIVCCVLLCFFKFYILLSLVALSLVLTAVFWLLLFKKSYWSTYIRVTISLAFGYCVGIAMLAVLVRQESFSEMLLWGYGALVLVLTVISGFWVRYRIRRPKPNKEKKIDKTLVAIIVIVITLLIRIVFMQFPESAYYLILTMCFAIPVYFIPQMVAQTVKLLILHCFEKGVM